MSVLTALRERRAPSPPLTGGNPYPGPRPFEDDAQYVFSGRDDEARTLFSLIVAHRVVVLYSPSGAGKTSLLNARLLGMLRDQGFEVFPITRLGASPHLQGIAHEARNIFTTIAVAQWDSRLCNSSVYGHESTTPGGNGTRVASATLGTSNLIDAKLSDFFEAHPHRVDEDGEPQPRVIVFDQFEELFTCFPHRWRDRAAFLDELTGALERDPMLRVVFAMRDDMITLLEAQSDHLPRFGVTRMRLERLNIDQARDAIIEPARANGRHYTDDAVEWLLQELRTARVEVFPGTFENVEGEYVEPVQLQIVCRGLWQKLGSEAKEITREHTETLGDVSEALRAYYDRAVSEVARETKVREARIREWFESKLITRARTRGTAFREATTTAKMSNEVIDALDDHHIIRAEARAGGRWYELTHDRFIGPILDGNREWRRARMERRSRLISGSVYLLMTLIAGLSVVASYRNRARETPDANVNVAAYLAAQAESTSATDLTHSLEQAIAAATVSADSATIGVLHRIVAKYPLALALRGHTAPLRSATYNRDGNLILTTSEDSTARVWNATTGECIRVLRGHRGWVLSGTFSPDGRYIVTAGRDSVALVWDASTGEILARLPQLREYTRSVRFVGDKPWLITTGDDPFVHIWAARSWTRPAQDIRIRRGPIRDASMSAVSVFGTVGDDGWLRLWKPGDWKNADAVHADSVGVLYRVAFSSDTTLVAVGHDAGVRIWTTRDLKVAYNLDHRAPVYAVAFSRDSRTLVTGARDGKIRLWSLADLTMPAAIITAHTGQVWEVSMSPRGEQFVSAGGDNVGRVWNLGRQDPPPSLTPPELIETARKRVWASPEHP